MLVLSVAPPCTLTISSRQSVPVLYHRILVIYSACIDLIAAAVVDFHSNPVPLLAFRIAGLPTSSKSLSSEAVTYLWVGGWKKAHRQILDRVWFAWAASQSARQPARKPESHHKMLYLYLQERRVITKWTKHYRLMSDLYGSWKCAWRQWNSKRIVRALCWWHITVVSIERPAQAGFKDCTAGTSQEFWCEIGRCPCWGKEAGVCPSFS